MCNTTPPEFHGKAIALDVNDQHAPLPLLFPVHEHRARGRNFLQPTFEVELTNRWQTWLVEGGVVNEWDDGTVTFNRDAPITGGSGRLQTSSTAAGPESPGSRIVIIPPTDDLVKELLAFQHTMPSWTAWQREAMGQEGTGEENAENIGVESESAEWKDLGRTFDIELKTVGSSTSVVCIKNPHIHWE
jgi:hypothetical protein